jgi:peptidyl-dipeptidase A
MKIFTFFLEIEEIISTSRNAEELAYTWTAWRDASGRPIREMYKEYIALSNKAAEANGNYLKLNLIY